MIEFVVGEQTSRRRAASRARRTSVHPRRSGARLCPQHSLRTCAPSTTCVYNIFVLVITAQMLLYPDPLSPHPQGRRSPHRARKVQGPGGQGHTGVPQEVGDSR